MESKKIFKIKSLLSLEREQSLKSIILEMYAKKLAKTLCVVNVLYSLQLHYTYECLTVYLSHDVCAVGEDGLLHLMR